MKGATRKRKAHGESRHILAANVDALLHHNHPESRNLPKTLAGRAHISFSSAQRVLDAATAATTDTLDQIAAAFSIDPWALLQPGLDPAHASREATEQEQERIREMTQLAERIGELLKEGGKPVPTTSTQQQATHRVTRSDSLRAGHRKGATAIPKK